MSFTLSCHVLFHATILLIHLFTELHLSVFLDYSYIFANAVCVQHVQIWNERSSPLLIFLSLLLVLVLLLLVFVFLPLFSPPPLNSNCMCINVAPFSGHVYLQLLSVLMCILTASVSGHVYLLLLSLVMCIYSFFSVVMCFYSSFLWSCVSVASFSGHMYL